MTRIPDAINYVQIEETAAYAPVAESTLFKVGGSMNYLLDHYPQIPGGIIAFGGVEANVPSGYLVCDGRTFNRASEPLLFSAIGTQWGVGDGISTANTPDLRGYFQRMVDLTAAGQAGRDPGHAGRTPSGTGTSEEAGSIEQGAILEHGHLLPISGGSTPGSGIVTDGGPFSLTTTTTTFGIDGSTPRGESRPLNAYVMYLIKT